MKTTLLLLFALYSSLVFCQTDEVKLVPSEFSKFTIGLAYSPEISYRLLSEGSNSNSSTEQSIIDKNSNDSIKFGQSGRFILGYGLSDKLTLESGIGYTNFGNTTKSKPIYYMPTDNGDPGSTILEHTEKRFHVISVPINLHTRFGQNRLKGFFSAGVAPGLLISSTKIVHFEYESGKKTKNVSSTNDLENFSNFILGVQVSGGVDFQFTKHVSLRVAPVFRMTANSIFADKEIRGNFFNAGIEIATVFTL